MKKNLLLILIVIFFSTNDVYALENNYMNLNNIPISEIEYENLIKLGFTGEQIKSMTEDEFLANKDLEGEIVAQTVKYYKTTTTYREEKLTRTFNYNIVDSNTEEITEEEYEKAESQISTYALLNGYTETTYKKMTTTIISVNNRYRYKNDLFWKIMPATRSYDILSIGIDSTVSGIPNTKYYRTTYDMTYNSGGGYCSTSTTGTWNMGPNGYVVTFDLPNNTSSANVTALSSYMYFEVQKLTNNTINTLNAYGNYKHAQKSVNSSVTTGVSVGINGAISFDISISSEITTSYDSMSTAQAVLFGISW